MTAPGLGAPTLCEAFQQTAGRFADQPALRTPGDRESMTWREYATRVEQVAGGLAQLGVGKGDTVALMLHNRPEFHVLDTAALHLGATPFSIYNTASPAQIAELFANAENRLTICEREFSGTLREAGAEQLVEIEDGLPEAGHPDFEAAWQAVGPEDVATLIYTSGTTGPPKGVLMTHANLLAALRGWDGVVALPAGGRVVSYLPLAHIADRFVAHYWSLVTGATVTSVDDPRAVIEALPDVRPTSFLAVPRIWEKLQAALIAKGLTDPAALPDDVKVVVHERLGLDCAEWLASGSAPIAPQVLEYFASLGMPVIEGWAMSETGCSGTINPPDAIRVGTVGKPVPEMEARLLDDGELLVRGPSVMRGYRNDPEKTAAALDSDGWLHTGDIAEIDDDGYVRIVDRKKELIINAAGKNMSPANIEQALKSASPLIGQACAIGNRRPYNVALLVLDPEAAAGRGADDSDIRREVAAAVERANAQLSRVEQIKRYALLPDDWIPDSDELTATMKLKRRGITEKYAAEIEALYT
jgi:long-subunit acyl-CoA synthetase (AMP-forming)